MKIIVWLVVLIVVLNVGMVVVDEFSMLFGLVVILGVRLVISDVYDIVGGDCEELIVRFGI